MQELQYVESASEWLSDTRFVAAKFYPGDELIDSAGDVYSLAGADSGTLQHTGVTLSADAVLELVKQHASVCGHCCVSKMGASSRAEAIQLVQHIE